METEAHAALFRIFFGAGPEYCVRRIVIVRGAQRAEARPLNDASRERRFEVEAMPHIKAAYELARWLTGSSQDAEDVVQESYLRA